MSNDAKPQPTTLKKISIFTMEISVGNWVSWVLDELQVLMFKLWIYVCAWVRGKVWWMLCLWQVLGSRSPPNLVKDIGQVEATNRICACVYVDVCAQLFKCNVNRITTTKLYITLKVYSSNLLPRSWFICCKLHCARQTKNNNTDSGKGSIDRCISFLAVDKQVTVFVVVLFFCLIWNRCYFACSILLYLCFFWNITHSFN